MTFYTWHLLYVLPAKIKKPTHEGAGPLAVTTLEKLKQVRAFSRIRD